jgi:NAD(P)-dependent dehydrogenase (short-subunit alcohol dehydrogenase family)
VALDRLEGRVAVVTGGASGIGRAMGERFAREGMHVVLADVERAALDATVHELRDGAAGLDVSGVVTDVSDFASVEALRDAVLDRHGAVHVCATTPAWAPGPRGRCGTTRSTTGPGRSA